MTGSANDGSFLFAKKLGNRLECVGIISLLSGPSASNGVEVQATASMATGSVRQLSRRRPSLRPICKDTRACITPPRPGRSRSSGDSADQYDCTSPRYPDLLVRRVSTHLTGNARSFCIRSCSSLFRDPRRKALPQAFLRNPIRLLILRMLGGAMIGDSKRFPYFGLFCSSKVFT